MPFCNLRQGRLCVVQFALVATFVFAFLFAASEVTSLAAHTQAPVKQVKAKARIENSDEYWANHVDPILDRMCLKCHAGVRQRGGLDLRSLETTLRGGDSGPAIVPGRPNESRLLQYIAPKSEPHMPLDSNRQLSPEEIAVLKTWIAQLPAPKTKLPSDAATKNAWVQGYLTEYRQALQSHEIAPANLSGSAAIDWFLKTDWKRDNLLPARQCDDSTFARRIYLDLAGRIPTRDEVKSFMSSGADRRGQLVARLIDSNEYPRHMREVFDTALMGRPANGAIARERADNGWNAFLEDAFRANRPWNETVRSMIVARATDGLGRGATCFLSERNNHYQAIAEAVAPVVFGVQIKCAQCHNHPLSWEIEQRHYWGLVAVFNRGKNIDTETGPGVAESAVGGFINFANLKKESQPAALVFLNGKSVAERVPGPDEKEVDRPDLYIIPPAKEGRKPHSPAVPKFSRREAFADAVTTPDNPALARAFVNRIWAQFMGRGIVQPVDQIDSRHRPSHPELLDWLSHDFERSGYDVKRLVRNIVLTQAYQLDSRPSGKTPPLPESFARGLEKPLSAEQLLRSLWIATGNKPEAEPAPEIQQAFAAAFPDVMADTYSPSLQQALFLSNSSVLDDLLKPAPGNTTAKLMALGSNEARVREAFNTVFGRAPDAAELQQCLLILKAEPPEKCVRSLLWALMTGAEFMVNH